MLRSAAPRAAAAYAHHHTAPHRILLALCASCLLIVTRGAAHAQAMKGASKETSASALRIVMAINGRKYHKYTLNDVESGGRTFAYALRWRNSGRRQ